MPLTAKGETIKSALVKEYGAAKGEQVLYAGKNVGTFSGIDAAKLDSALVRAEMLHGKVDAMCRRTDASDDPPIVQRGTPERGVKIPPPKDPKERETWERAVAARKAAGKGPYVGDDAKADDHRVVGGVGFKSPA